MPTIGYVFMNMFKESTRGAHDGGFLGMFFGLFIGQMVFTMVMLNMTKFYSFFIGIGLAFITILLSFLIMTLVRGVLFPETNDLTYLINPDPKIDLILEVVFFGTLCFMSIVIFTLINRIVAKNND
ncbi:MAG: hypothetical protein ACO1N0_11150 [Fluviicola sp.]